MNDAALYLNNAKHTGDIASPISAITTSFEVVNGCNAAVSGAIKVSVVVGKIGAPCLVARRKDIPMDASTEVLNVGPSWE